MLEGSITLSGSNLRLTAALIRDPTDADCGPTSYNRSVNDALITAGRADAGPGE